MVSLRLLGWIPCLVWSSPQLSETNGARVELEGNRLFVSAPCNDELDDSDNFTDNGAVYVFERQGTGFVQTLKSQASDAVADDRLGEDGFAVAEER